MDRTVPRSTGARLAPLIEARLATVRAITGLSDDELVHVGVTPEWSVRDLLAHLAAWDREEVRGIEAWIDGTSPPPAHPDFDAFNAEAVARARTQPLAATLIALMRTHEELLAAIVRIGERNGKFRGPEGNENEVGMVGADARRHEGEHTRQIVAWRTTLSQHTQGD